MVYDNRCMTIPVMEMTIVGRMIWGVALTLMGIGVFFRVPQVMPRISQIPAFSHMTPFLWFCFYFMAVLLVGGGFKRIYSAYRRMEGRDSTSEETDDAPRE